MRLPERCDCGLGWRLERCKVAWFVCIIVLAVLSLFPRSSFANDPLPTEFLSKYCIACHAASEAAAGLDLAAAPPELNADSISRWIRVYDRLASREMPPRDSEQPSSQERDLALQSLHTAILFAENRDADAIASVRRLTRSEYENTIRDLFDMPGIALSGNLPADGQVQGFDKHPDGLDVSHVNIARYLEAADHILGMAIATRPEPPTVQTRRISLVNRGGFVAHIVMNGDGVLLKNGQPDPEFPPAGEQNHLDEGAHERWGSFRNGASVGLFRHEDESVSPYFIEHVTVYPAKYRVRTSLWSFQWKEGAMLPGRGTEAARLSVVQLTGDGRGGQHPSYVLGYFDAPKDAPLEHTLTVWLNPNEILGFNTASLAPAANYYKKKRAMEFIGPGIVVDWLDIEGPLYATWPPPSHRMLFGDLPLREFKSEEHPGVRAPKRQRPPQLGAGMNRPDPEPGIWTVHSDTPLADADRLLASVLPKWFRRAVSEETRAAYVGIVRERLAAGDCFEDAMRAAYRGALVSPDFLWHLESSDGPKSERDGLDDAALACRLSYFLWNSCPDDALMHQAASGELRRPASLRATVERMLADPRSQRFVNDFVGQWLKLHKIAATDPDRKLYPEFSPYLQDCMVAETRAYFRELLDRDLDASHLMQSDFVMINEKLAAHYGIPDVQGTPIRRVRLPEGCPRGGLLTQASLLKITANGTTTSPVPRGAFVLDRLLGEPPEPPPANVPAIEPDVRGATSIRDQLDKHRQQAVCASCHQRIDPPGFALEAFDVIGGYRQRYRSIGEGDPAERGNIDPGIALGFKLGPHVDSTGQLVDGRNFSDVKTYQALMASDSRRLLMSLAKQLALYATGRAVRFGDRPAIERVVDRTMQRGGGIRTLLHELVASPWFAGDTRASDADVEVPAANEHAEAAAPSSARHQRVGAAWRGFLMVPDLASVVEPVMRRPVDGAIAISADGSRYTHDTEIVVRIIGWFQPDRVEELKQIVGQLPEVQLVSVDDRRATATLKVATDSPMFRNATRAQVLERLSQRIQHESVGRLSLRELGSVPDEQLQSIEIGVAGLDCAACSLALHDILVQSPGVVHATASFRDGKAVAWVDRGLTDRAALEMLLKQRGVTLRSVAPQSANQP